MFKRAHSTKSNNLISNSVRKKLIQETQSDFFNNEQQDQKQIILHLIPNEPITITKAYTHLNHQLFIYNDHQNQPIWIKLDKGNGRLIPTVYTLLKYPNLLPMLRTNRMVLEKLSQGADLMIPGLIQSDLESIQHLKKDSLISIVPSDSIHLVWAVGFLAEDVSTLLTRQSGKAVITIHTQNDYLWNSGTKEIPNQLDFVPSPSQNNFSVENSQTEKISSPELNHLVKLEKLSIDQHEEDPKNLIISNQSSASNPDITHSIDHNPPSTASPILSPTEVDNILKQALLTSLWNQKVQNEIPMPASKFYSNFILPYRHFECPKSIGVKESTAKNLAKWLKNMNKLNFITIKEDHKKRAETLIIHVNLDHPELEQFRKYRTIHDQEKSDLTHNQHDQLDNDRSAIDANSCLFQLPETKITSVYKAKKDEGGWFWLVKIDLDPEALYTQQQIKEHLLNYINKNLVPTTDIKKEKKEEEIKGRGREGGGGKKKVNFNLIQPDDYLLSAMGNLAYSEHESFNRNQILDLVLSNSFIHWWRLERNLKVLIEKKGEIPRVILKMKKKSGSKQSTLITGLEFFGIDPIRFAKELKTLCAGSTTTHPIINDPNNYNKILKELIVDTKIALPSSITLIEVECQGDQRHFLNDYLSSSNSLIPQNSIAII